ncbi:MAG: efflux RND transporter periplasmic adaptor subunit [Candidatus Gastranaerophilaceae bacterium]|jgi:RND family efflux transporter MFP subunit
MKKILLITTFLALITSGCTAHNDKEAQKPVVSGVKIQTIAQTNVDNFYETSATVKSKTNSVVSSMIMGRVTSLRIKEGDKVRAGQLLLTIDSRDTAQKALGAQAGVNEALKGVESADQNRKLINKTYERYKNLYYEQVMTKQEFDQIATQKNVADIEYQRALQGVNRARAGLGEIGVYQSYARITAPISGIVTQKNIDLGSTAVPGQPLLTIEKPSSLELTADINESLIKKVKTGMTVYLESNGKSIKSKITIVIPSIDPMTRTFKVKITLSGLTSGEYVKVKIPFSKKEAILIPSSSIVQKGQLTGVYTVDDKNIISYRLIRTGKTSGTDVEILSGLNNGEKIITFGVDKAIDGGVWQSHF